MTNNATTAANEFSGKTALVVDDGPIERLAGKSMLQKMGLSAQAAASGEEALRMLAAQAVDIAICDISMPGMSGLELLDAAKKLQSVPLFIMVSSHDDEAHAQAALARGAAAYLVKPLRFDTLRDAITDVLQSHKA
jgi:CheY-like chemotaxis protein